MAHYYDPKTGEPRHFVEKKDGSGNRPSTIADARKNGWVPGVTTVLDVLAKPALVRWMVTQGVLAVTTAPDVPGEDLGQKIERILNVEKQQDQESKLAMDRGTAMHEAIEAHFTGKPIPEEHHAWVWPAIEAIKTYGATVAVEKILVGDGYAGKCDLITEAPDCFWILDWKSAKTLPDPKKGAWTEHRMQAAAYAAAYYPNTNAKPIRTANCYISTVECGKFVACEHDPDWQRAFNGGFRPALELWCFLNNYKP